VAAAALEAAVGEMPSSPPALPVSRGCSAGRREGRWHRGDGAGSGLAGIFLPLI